MKTLEQGFGARVNDFLGRTGMRPTTLGMRALGDPNFVREIRAGRSPTLRTADRVDAFMAARDQGPGGPGHPLRPRSERGRSGRSKTAPGSGAAGRIPRRRSSARPTRLLRLPEVQARTGLSRTTIYKWRIAGRFPGAIPLGKRCVGWVESEIEEWLGGAAARATGSAVRRRPHRPERPRTSRNFRVFSTG